MSQQVYEILVFVCEIVHVIVQCILFGALWNIFYRLDRRIKTWQAVIFVILNIGLKICLDVPSWVRYALAAVFVLGCCLAEYDGHKYDAYTYAMHNYAPQKHTSYKYTSYKYTSHKYTSYMEKAVFVMLLFYNFHGLSFLISNSVYVFITDRLWERADAGVENYILCMYQNIITGMIWLLLSYVLVFLIMIWSVGRIVKKSFAIGGQDAVFLSVLNVTGGMLAWMIMDLSMVETGRGIFLLFDDKREMIWKVPVIAVFIYLGELSAIYIYRKYMELQEEREKHFVEEQQMKALKRRLKEAEDFYGSIRKVRHEMKNHMINIKGLAAGEKYNDLETYIEKLDETIQTLDYRFHTGNAVTDVIINDKYRKAKEAGFSLQMKGEFGDTGTIPAFDIGIILNNLLDNAIEACEKMEEGQRYILLTVKKRNRFLLIGVENSFDGKLKWKGGDAVPETTKQKDFMEHGIGLKNVRETADRYFGDMNIEAVKNVFKVTVMLQQGREAPEGSSYEHDINL